LIEFIRGYDEIEVTYKNKTQNKAKQRGQAKKRFE